MRPEPGACAASCDPTGRVHRREPGRPRLVRARPTPTTPAASPEVTGFVSFRGAAHDSPWGDRPAAHSPTRGESGTTGRSRPASTAPRGADRATPRRASHSRSPARRGPMAPKPRSFQGARAAKGRPSGRAHRHGVAGRRHRSMGEGTQPSAPRRRRSRLSLRRCRSAAARRRRAGRARGGARRARSARPASARVRLPGPSRPRRWSGARVRRVSRPSTAGEGAVQASGGRVARRRAHPPSPPPVQPAGGWGAMARSNAPG